MRHLLALLFTPVFFASCACAGQLDDVEQLTSRPAAAADERAPVTGGSHIYDPDDRQPCQSLYEPHLEIPCGDIINICSDSPHGPSAMFLPEAYRCTPDSPALRDLCYLVPVEELPFYGLTTEDC